MPLTSLAAVELQLVMHCLERWSLLHFARCCRATYAAASHPFAFHGMREAEQNWMLQLRCKGREPPPHTVFKRLSAALGWAWQLLLPAGVTERWASPRIPTPLSPLQAASVGHSLLRFYAAGGNNRGGVADGVGVELRWRVGTLADDEGTELRAQAEAVSCIPMLRELSVFDMHRRSRTDPYCQQAHGLLLVEALAQHVPATLTSLELHEVCVDEAAAAQVLASSVFTRCTALRKFSLDCQLLHMQSDGYVELMRALAALPCLVELNLTCPLLWDTRSLPHSSEHGLAPAVAANLRNNAVDVAQLLRDTRSLERLNLLLAFIGDEGARQLASALLGNWRCNGTRLREMDLRCNYIGDAGTRAFLDVMPQLSALQATRAAAELVDQSATATAAGADGKDASVEDNEPLVILRLGNNLLLSYSTRAALTQFCRTQAQLPRRLQMHIDMGRF